MIGNLRDEEKLKYFGRADLYYNTAQDYIKFIEWKMFNSTTDSKQLRRYIEAAVELTKLCANGNLVELTYNSLREALEKGYNRR